MSLQGHLAQLKRRHKVLESEISKEAAHPSTDDARLCELKKKKLQLKDEIQKFDATSVEGAVVH